MPPRRNPTVRQKRLGAELRRLREAAGLSGDQAGEILECGKGKVSRIESGLSGIRPVELRVLLRAYGMSDRALIDALVEMAKEGNRRGWWNRYGNVLPPGFADVAQLEAKATSIHAWQTVLVPGLLQTPDYMRAFFRHGRVAASEEDIARQIEARTARQAVLDQEGAPEFWAVLYEPVLKARIGGTSVMQGQLRHLAAIAESGRATLQVMPYEAGAHRGLDGPFLVFGTPVPGMDVVLLDNAASPVYVEDDDGVQAFRSVFDTLRATALGPEPSLAAIRAAANGLA
ncbi:helix-turn-helix domain-containing protein [Streptomyces sp. NBC_00237]|uniref:helix-turn-helix domain-containing protein n=1 Tax=Streptomyces sp. NBC_00237 TaxID=2975687 RepID=UPI00224ECAA8|nr:helix-turn-helix transcriptional regulator [Streptomyces sp. NBC_00237]MCX5200806.1 helix-turn-helix domain-containing protein [Streptomyces sp. NBC_00237]